MTNNAWGTIHSSVFADAGRLLRQVGATQRPHGAVRYRCPVMGSFILLTESATLEKLENRRARLRCSGCGEMHMLICDTAGDDSAVIVGPMGPA
jgi:hypothetical protein